MPDHARRTTFMLPGRRRVRATCRSRGDGSGSRAVGVSALHHPFEDLRSEGSIFQVAHPARTWKRHAIGGPLMRCRRYPSGAAPTGAVRGPEELTLRALVRENSAAGSSPEERRSDEGAFAPVPAPAGTLLLYIRIIEEAFYYSASFRPNFAPGTFPASDVRSQSLRHRKN